MNTTEMHIGVNLGVQKIASNLRDDFLPQEIDYYLNESVKDYVKQQYSHIKTEARNIQSQYVSENIRTLVKTAEIANISVVSFLPNTISGDLPADYLYYIFARTNHNNEWFNNRKLEPKAIKDYVESESNSPRFREFPLLLQGSDILVIGDATTTLSITTKIYFTYVSAPVKLNISTLPNQELNLPEHTHDEIVNLTVAKLLAVLGEGAQ